MQVKGSSLYVVSSCGKRAYIQFADGTISKEVDNVAAAHQEIKNALQEDKISSNEVIGLVHTIQHSMLPEFPEKSAV